ncbi:MarR family transcriptional regulator [Egibacter rhizosphaerae]|uniref:MarR family transcriptional regulator n=1 Tax=Egibacter rhizosphaerae TaxID=1670831 RepID=A0A411YK91_9ACTN|nr:MarR family transcriptional regulator [Egibacter rhizosphaerae]QBI21601.1 MarR family transcriptional regulator [Egibacter rhizosphaerae]
MMTTARDVTSILGDLDRLLSRVVNPVLEEVGLEREHWQALRILADDQGHSMGGLCERLGLAGATATRIVDLLATSMLAYRRSDPLDRRRVLVYASDQGHALLHEVEERVTVHLDDALTGFQPEEYERLTELLQRLISVADSASTPGT